MSKSSFCLWNFKDFLQRGLPPPWARRSWCRQEGESWHPSCLSDRGEAWFWPKTKFWEKIDDFGAKCWILKRFFSKRCQKSILFLKFFFDLKTHDTLLHEHVTLGYGDVQIFGLTSGDHVSILEFHDLGTLGAHLTGDGNLFWNYKVQNRFIKILVQAQLIFFEQIWSLRFKRKLNFWFKVVVSQNKSSNTRH